MDRDTRGNAIIGLQPSRIVAALVLFVLFLLAAHALAVYLRYVHDIDYAMGFVPRFYMNYERGVPAYFSSTLLLAGGLLFYLLHRLAGGGQRHWLVLSLVFAFLAVDESAGLHELLSEPVSRFVGTGGVLTYAWIVPYGIAVLLLGLYLLPRIWKLRPDVRLLFFGAGAIYVGGALGMEMLAGYAGLDGHTKSLAFEVVTTLEELMEMSGVILLLYAQLRLMRAENRDVAIRVL